MLPYTSSSESKCECGNPGTGREGSPATAADPPRNSLVVARPAVVSCPAHRANALGRAAQVIKRGPELRPAQLVQQDWDSKWRITM